MNPLEAPAKPPASIDAAITKAAGEPSPGDLTDEALLTRFLLDNLSS